LLFYYSKIIIYLSTRVILLRPHSISLSWSKAGSKPGRKPGFEPAFDRLSTFSGRKPAFDRIDLSQHVGIDLSCFRPAVSVFDQIDKWNAETTKRPDQTTRLCL